MKKMKLLVFAAIVFASCNSSAPGTTDATKDTTAATGNTAVNYPYTIDHPDYWEIGSSANTMTALSSLKAFENGNVAESMQYFADSVHVEFDGLDKKMSNDSLKAMFTDWRNNYKSVEVKMEDWESVISKDKKEEWVTLWYSQKWEDKNGKKDSADFIDDLKMQNGKIIQLDEYTRKTHS